ncbi:protein ROS1C [Lolium rigidum]|nr:protein ROS1C [Lolium rigidum]
MKGSFPLNGTYFQVNEVFADHKSSHDPIHVVREQLWNLERRMVYFGTSVPSIFKGLTTEEVQQCFWRGFVCVRGFDMETRAPRPLCPHLHLAASKLPRSRKSVATEQNTDSARASVS